MKRKSKISLPDSTWRKPIGNVSIEGNEGGFRDQRPNFSTINIYGLSSASKQL